MTYFGLPKKVKVGSIAYAVVASTEAHDEAQRRMTADDESGFLEGWSSGRLAEIGLMPGMNTQYARQVMVHEVLHQVLTVSAIEVSLEDEERMVRAMESGVLQVLRDNPALVKWLTDK